MQQKLNKLFTSLGLFLLLGMLCNIAIGEEAILYQSNCTNTSDCQDVISVPKDSDTVIEKANGTFRLATGRHGTNSSSATVLFNKTDAPQKQTPKFKQIPIRFDTNTSDSTDLGEVYAGLTEVIPNSNIFVGALHVFKQDLHREVLTTETIKKLENFKIILFKKSSNYLDLILFAPANLSEASLKNILNSISLPELNIPWISFQVGVMDTVHSTDITTDQFSEGNIVMIRDEDVGALYFNLSNTSENFTSAASSGSLILNNNYKPLGVLQCLETISGEESTRSISTKLFRAISLNIDFNIVTPIYLDSLENLMNVEAQKLKIEDNCIPVDKNGAGGT